MIYQWHCLICNEHFRVNGIYTKRTVEHEHLQNIHPEKLKELSEMQHQITDIQTKISNFKKEIWSKVE